MFQVDRLLSVWMFVCLNVWMFECLNVCLYVCNAFTAKRVNRLLWNLKGIFLFELRIDVYVRFFKILHLKDEKRTPKDPMLILWEDRMRTISWRWMLNEDESCTSMRALTDDFSKMIINSDLGLSVCVEKTTSVKTHACSCNFQLIVFFLL